jgi:flagellar biosynthesis/type III secretory pathway protein FliH
LKTIKELINNRILFDSAMALDCSPEHYDAVREVVDAVRQVYMGIAIP